MNFKVETEQEEDGRWIAEVLELPGALAYGSDQAQAVSNAEAVAFRILADRLEAGEPVPGVEQVFAVAA